MAILPLVIAPDPRLKQVSKPVEVVDASIQTLIDDMFDTMYDANGIGLAAVQVGVHKRILVLDVEQREEPGPHGDMRVKPMVFINPEIVQNAPELSVYKEGCLSFPGQYSEVSRPKTITVKYLDREGKAQTLVADGLLATCLQHEIDHLNGIVFVDHISSVKRDMILRKLQKAKKFAADHHHDHHHDHVHDEFCNHS